MFARVMLISVVSLAMGPVVALAQHDHSGHQHGQSKEPAALPNCPVTGDEPINLGVSVATPEGPVFFCCKDCIPKYQADPGKYASKVEAQRKALADRPKVQINCPACAEPVDPKIGVEAGGRKVFFSSTECMNKYKGDPGKYASALANSHTFQTQCPVMGESIDPKSFTTLANGAKVYFCCPKCEKKLFAEPGTYAPKLAAQGYTFAPKELTAGPVKDEPGHQHKGHEHDHDH